VVCRLPQTLAVAREGSCNAAVGKVQLSSFMPSGHRRRGPSVLRRPAHGGRGAQRPSMHVQCGRGLHALPVFIGIHCQGGAGSIVVPSQRAVGQPRRAWRSGSVSQGASAQRSVRAVRPAAASARWVWRAASLMQQPNTLVPFGPGVKCSTNATANPSFKRTATGVPVSAA
jgi:hypothetical protein